MVTVVKFSHTISPQEYEKNRDKIIELLTKCKEDVLMSLSHLNYQLNLDETLPPAYVIGRMRMKALLKTEHSMTYRRQKASDDCRI